MTDMEDEQETMRRNTITDESDEDDNENETNDEEEEKPSPSGCSDPTNKSTNSIERRKRKISKIQRPLENSIAEDMQQGSMMKYTDTIPSSTYLEANKAD